MKSPTVQILMNALIMDTNAALSPHASIVTGDTLVNVLKGIGTGCHQKLSTKICQQKFVNKNLSTKILATDI